MNGPRNNSDEQALGSAQKHGFLQGTRRAKASSAARLRKIRSRTSPSLELLEDRMLLANFSVTSNADTNTSGTLRYAINQLDATGGATNTITFSLSSTQHTITPGSVLPSITKPVVIEGNTETGYAGVPLVEITGGSAGSVNGLTLAAGSSGSVIQDLVIDGFASGDGISIASANDSVTGCYIGTTVAGTGAKANQDGVLVGAAGVTIGGTAAGAGNVISGNSVNGIDAEASCAIEGNLIGTNKGGTGAVANPVGVYVGSSGVTIGGVGPGVANLISGNSHGVVVQASCSVTNNLIGTNQSGLGAVPNGTGISVFAPGATIGGTSGVVGNLISGNSINGIDIEASCLVAGNVIGATAAKTAVLPNGFNGIYVGQPGATIGGLTTAAGNVISGNGSYGVNIQASCLLEGNGIGSDSTGDKLPNGIDGVYVFAAGATIGGTSTGTGNLISGNTSNGIDIEASCLVQGNAIGTNAAGSAIIANQSAGIYVGALGATIGGTSAGSLNLISGNGTDGINLEAPCVVEGNLIGLNEAGIASLANAAEGIYVGVSGVTIGGILAGAGNVVSGNGDNGVLIAGSSCLLEGNLIGTGPAGAGSVPNGVDGVLVNATGATIGGTVATAGNVISANRRYGVNIAAACVVEGNLIGTNAAAATTVPNGDDGIYVGASGATIGGTSATAANVISGNARYGVNIAAACLVEGNLIGTNATASAAVANLNDGVYVSAPGATIGGTTSAAANTISGNLSSGVFVSAACLLEGNLIGSNLAGLALPNLNGVYVNAAGATIGGKGNVISGNTGAGIILAAPAVVEGNLIGTDPTGTTALGNGGDGIDVEAAAAGATIGSVTSGESNIVSGNASYGINVEAPSVVIGNLVGINAAGTAAVGNGADGIYVGASGSTIGGTAVGAGNTVSGNKHHGIDLLASALLEGNLIGTNSLASGVIANAEDGIFVNASGGTIGGTASAAANIISGNLESGVYLAAASLVEGNLIGTNWSGIKLPNLNGIVADAPGATIGGQGNIISGNTGTGLVINAPCTVEGNLIGTDPTGTIAVANGGDGIDVDASGAVIGATAASEANIISGNAANGIVVGAPSLVLGNLIGTGLAGSVAVPNSGSGIVVQASNVTIGGSAAGAGNTIAFNNSVGVAVNSGSGNSIVQNLITSNAVGEIQVAAGANNNIQPPSIQAYTSVKNLTTINYTVTGIVGNTYSVDFYGSSSPSDPYGEYVGSKTVTLSAASQSFTAVFTNPTALLSSQTMTATATGTDGSTSGFATPVSFSNPYVVTTGSNSGVGSLAQAILDSNAAPGTPITFTLPAPYQIRLTTALPGITQPVVINGASLPHFNPSGSAIVQIIAQANGLGDGLDLLGGSDGSTIEDLMIGGFGSGNGIGIFSGGNQIVGDYLGYAPGSIPFQVPNGTGIVVNVTSPASAAPNTIGGTSPGQGNMISGNKGAGIAVFSPCLIEGNLIGTNAAGTTALPNGTDGINVEASATIGGTTSGADNVISGNGQYGLYINAPCLVVGNRIGTNASGTAGVPNTGDGIDVESSGATIGGASAGTGNLISGNEGDGLSINASCLVEGNLIGTDITGTTPLANYEGVLVMGGNPTIGGTSAGAGNILSGNLNDGLDVQASCLIEGNFIGTNAAGTTAVGNGYIGVEIQIGGAGTTVGGTTPGAGNVISGNSSYGVKVTDRSLVEGNLIGTNAAGTAAVPNKFSGVYVEANGATIGGALAGAGNTVSGNSGDGILVGEPCLVEGNLIGTTAAGTSALPNTSDGIDVVYSGSTIGGTAAGTRNLISGNTGYGIHLQSSSLIEGNLIGTNLAGTAAIANTIAGIYVGGSGATIGGSSSGDANIISGNYSAGIDIESSCTVVGNFIGTDVTGTVAVPNQSDGIYVGATGAMIGGTLSGDANIISGNFGFGVNIEASCTVAGNLIGTDITGTAALGNLTDGIYVGGTGATIGGATPGADNVISGNGVAKAGQITALLKAHPSGFGIDIEESCLVEGNLIGTNKAGSGAISNVSSGILVNGYGATIGGPSAGSGNVISGNAVHGIDVESACLIESNLIGTNAAGTAPVTNQKDGIYVGASNATIGASTFAGANVISGNAANGIDIEAPCQVAANMIGTNKGGTSAVANGLDGIYLGGSAATADESPTITGAIISGNKGDGIYALSPLSVEACLIGTGSAQNGNAGPAIPNQGGGIYIGAAGSTTGVASDTSVTGNIIDNNGSTGLAIHAPCDALGNEISGNSWDGIDVESSCVLNGNGVGTNLLGALPNGHDGIYVGAAGATIGGGNSIAANTNDGIDVEASCLIEGNLVGTNSSGTTALPNGADGIYVGSTGVTIGGTAAGDANVISGNGKAGIEIEAPSLVLGNLIGTNLTGTAAVANGGDGIDVEVAGATIGGTSAGASNVISGNAANGIFAAVASCLIEGNLIGTDPTGTKAVPNQGAGVVLAQGSTGVSTVGVSGSGNTIAFNDGPGVATSPGTTGGTIRFNSIFDNAGPGIDLNDNGVTPNSPNGANNTPVLTSVGIANVSGTLSASPYSTYVIDFYANPFGDASSASPQGRTYLGSTTIATNAQGNVDFNFGYTPNSVEPFVTATATDASGTTSEFSAPVAYAVNASGVSLNATVGVPFQGVVASFTSSDLTATASGFMATINYGDGTPNATGTVVASPTGFVVIGTHTFIAANPAEPVTVTITDTIGHSQATANSLADVVAAGGALTPFGASAGFVAGTLSSQVVATFTDTDHSAFPGQFTATITWGDGTATSAGVVSVDGNGFSVTGTHNYSGAGTVPIFVSIHDAVSGETITADSTAVVSPAQYSLTATGVALSMTTGELFQGTIASFTTDAPSSTTADFTAAINYGDGTLPTFGTVVQAQGGFIVVGAHTYTIANETVPITVTITDSRGFGSATASSVANVASPPATVLNPFPQSAQFIAGTLYSVTVAGFTDSNPQTVPAQFTATINWGDGTASSTGTIAASGGGYSVTGSHTYNVANTYPVTVTIKDALTGITVIANSTAVVAPVPITIQPRNFSVTGGTAFSGTIATFTDGDPRTNPGFYTASINWGDGTPNTTGTITGSNPFTVTASHTFKAFQNTDLVTITITDQNGRTATAVDRVVDPPAVLDVLAAPITLTPNKPFHGVVATFTESGLTGSASDYKAIINWGKGRKTAGMITGSNGRFIVTAKHSFPRFSGTKPVTVTIVDPNGQTQTVAESASEVAHHPKVIKITDRTKSVASSRR
jgi:hypothetical protein